MFLFFKLNLYQFISDRSNMKDQKIPPYWVERRQHKHGLSRRESEDGSFLGDNNEGPLVRIIRVNVHYGHVGQLKRECTVLTRDIIA